VIGPEGRDARVLWAELRIDLGDPAAAREALEPVLRAEPQDTAELQKSETAGAAARAIAFEQIRSGQLVVDWREMGFSPQLPGQRTGRARQRAGRRSAARGRQ